MKIKYLTLILLIGCVILCGFLVYKIIDMSVTLDYTNNDINTVISDIKTIKKYQRTKCIDAYKKIDGINIFKKEGKLVINGVSFRCEARTHVLLTTDY